MACAKVSRFLRDTKESLWRQQGFAACDGVRAIAVLWVCGGHAMHFDINAEGYWRMLLPYTNDGAVDLFFVLSGFLIGGSLQREVTKDLGLGQTSWGSFYLRRFFRIVPAYLSACLASFIVERIAYSDDRSCFTLWRNFLFINNFFPPESCMGQGWSVAVEMHLYLLTPPLFVLAGKLSKRWSAPWTQILCATAWLACCLLRLQNVMALAASGSVAVADTTQLYFFSQYRFAPYVAGVFAGVTVTMDTSKDKDSQDSRLATILKHVARAFSYMALLLLWLNGGDFNNTVVPKEKLPEVILVLLMSFLRPLAGIAVAWLLVSCTRGEAPRLNAFLSARFWCPIAALSYSMYIMEDVGEKFSNWPFLEATHDLSHATPLVKTLRGYVAGLLYILAAMLLAIFNYTLVERPGILLGKRVLCAVKALSEPKQTPKRSPNKKHTPDLKPPSLSRASTSAAASSTSLSTSPTLNLAHIQATSSTTAEQSPARDPPLFSPGISTPPV